MKLQTFLDYYKPLDSEEKIDKLFALCFNSKHLPICANAFSKILDVTTKEIKPYFKKKKAEYDNYIVQLKKERKKAKNKRERLKGKAEKRSRRSSSSVYNKDDIVYKRIHIISTAM